MINGEKGEDGKRQGEKDETDRDREAKELLFVVFYPMLSVRERGMAISEAGKEAEFYKEYAPYMKKMVVSPNPCRVPGARVLASCALF